MSVILERSLKTSDEMICSLKTEQNNQYVKKNRNLCFSFKPRRFTFWITKLRHYIVVYNYSNFFGEFDLGSGRTLAACLIHASRARETDNHPSGCASVERAADG